MTVRIPTGERRCSTDEVVEKRGFAPVIPAIGRVVLAPGGELWVERGYISGEHPAVDVFAATGEYLGTLPRGSPFPAAFLPGDRFVTTEKDDLDVVRAVIYHVERNVSAD